MLLSIMTLKYFVIESEKIGVNKTFQKMIRYWRKLCFSFIFLVIFSFLLFI